MIGKVKVHDDQTPYKSIEIGDKYDVPVTVQLFNPGRKVLPDMSSISLVVHIEEKTGPRESIKHVLGSEHIVFSDAPRLAGSKKVEQSAFSVQPEFWFRAKLGDSYDNRADDEYYYTSPGLLLSHGRLSSLI